MLPEQVAPFLYRVFVLHKAEKMAKQAYRMQRGRLNTGLNVRTWGCATFERARAAHAIVCVWCLPARLSPPSDHPQLLGVSPTSWQLRTKRALGLVPVIPGVLRGTAPAARFNQNKQRRSQFWNAPPVKRRMAWRGAAWRGA